MPGQGHFTCDEPFLFTSFTPRFLNLMTKSINLYAITFFCFMLLKKVHLHSLNGNKLFTAIMLASGHLYHTQEGTLCRDIVRRQTHFFMCSSFLLTQYANELQLSYNNNGIFFFADDDID